MSSICVSYEKRPSALRYMVQAFRPKPRWDERRGFPDLCLAWHGVRMDPGAANQVARLAGVATRPDDERLSVLLPHVLGLRLLMAALTHPAWPIPIWRALQVRNRLLLHRPLRANLHFDLAVAVSAWRVLDKGLEVDLRTLLEQDGARSWESIVTFYYRGRFGAATAQGNADGAPPAAASVAVRSEETALGRMNGEGRWQLGALTGDYNGLHQWDGYARRFGFAAAFAHPQRAAALCLLHLAPTAPAPQRLDLWIKGPAYYGSDLVLRHSPRTGGSGHDFGLWSAADPRPSLIGSWDGSFTVANPGERCILPSADN